MVISFLIILFQKAFEKSLTMMNATFAKLGNVVKESHHMLCQISITFSQKMLHVYNATADIYIIMKRPPASHCRVPEQQPGCPYR
jgi:hypothetical protein